MSVSDVPTISCTVADEWWARYALPTLILCSPLLPDLILRNASSRVSKDEWHQWGLVVRDGAARLLTMRV